MINCTTSPAMKMAAHKTHWKKKPSPVSKVLTGIKFVLGGIAEGAGRVKKFRLWPLCEPGPLKSD
jgi:hypothetical protein